MLNRCMCGWGILVALTLAGCATQPGNGRPTGLPDAASPAFALRAEDDEMIVAVSPARQTLQIAGSSAAIIGAGISAVVNDRYQQEVRKALTGFNPGDYFEEQIRKRLDESLERDIAEVAPLGSTAGFDSIRQAQDARLNALSKRGIDVLLDLNMSYGLFGASGTLIAKLDGRLLLLPENHELWDETILVNPLPILANQDLKDPTQRLSPDFGEIRLTVEDNAVAKWTREDGAPLREGFKKAADAAISGMLCSLGLAEEATGEYYLGCCLMNRKRFSEADVHFKKALQLDPALTDAQNARAVNLAHADQIDDAIAVVKEITVAAPEYAPAWFNLAWWLAIEKKDPAAAKPCYEKACALGLAPENRIEKALGK